MPIIHNNSEFDAAILIHSLALLFTKVGFSSTYIKETFEPALGEIKVELQESFRKLHQSFKIKSLENLKNTFSLTDNAENKQLLINREAADKLYKLLIGKITLGNIVCYQDLVKNFTDIKKSWEAHNFPTKNQENYQIIISECEKFLEQAEKLQEFIQLENNSRIEFRPKF